MTSYVLSKHKEFSLSIVDKAILLLLFFSFHADFLQISSSVFIFKLHNLLSFLCFFLYLFRFGRFFLSKELLFGFLLVLFSFFLSFFYCVDKFRCAGFIFLYIFTVVMNFILPFNLFYYFNTKQFLKIYFLSFICAGSVAVVQFILSFFGIVLFWAQLQPSGIVRASALSYEPSNYALYMLLFAMFYNAYFILNKMTFNLFNVFKLMFINVILLISTSTAAFFAYFVFFAILMIVSLSKKIKDKGRAVKKLLYYAAVLSSMIAVFALVFRDLIARTFFKFFVVNFVSHGSFSQRWIGGFVNPWEVFLQKPLFGVGLGGVGSYIEANFDSGYFLLTPQAITNDADLKTFDCQNPTMDIVAGLGLFGVFCFIILVYFYVREFKRVLAMKSLAYEERANILSFVISILVVIFCWQTCPSLFRPYIWAHMAIALGYVYKVRRGLNASI